MRPGYRRFLKDSEERYQFGFEGLGRRPMNKLMDLVREIPGFVRLRADRSVYGHAKARVKDPRLRMALSFHPLFIGGDPTHVTSMYILVSHLEKEFGVHYAMGGVQAMADAMVRVIEDQGGTCAKVLRSTNPDAQRPRLRRAHDRRGGDANRYRRLQRRSGHTYGHLLRRAETQALDGQAAEPLALVHGSVRLVFRDKGHARQMEDVGHHTILNGPRYKGLLNDIFMRKHLAHDMSVYLHRPSVTDPSVAPEGDDTFYALSPVPNLHGEEAVDWARWRRSTAATSRMC
jgi:phytoene desaturase